MEEYLDILDEKGEKTGETRTYRETHRLGLLHRTVHVWILNSNKKLLIQKRSNSMGAYPGLWYMSAAGHISAGQTSLEGAKRETAEEVGLHLPEENFQYLFTSEEHVILNEGTYVNNEFNDVYLVILDEISPKIKIDEKEVSETKWISIDELKTLIKEKNKFVPHHEEEYRKLFEYLAKNN